MDRVTYAVSVRDMLTLAVDVRARVEAVLQPHLALALGELTIQRRERPAALWRTERCTARDVRRPGRGSGRRSVAFLRGLCARAVGRGAIARSGRAHAGRGGDLWPRVVTRRRCVLVLVHTLRGHAVNAGTVVSPLPC